MHFKFTPILLTVLILCTACGEAPIHDTTEKENTHDAEVTKDSISFGGRNKDRDRDYEIV